VEAPEGFWQRVNGLKEKLLGLRLPSTLWGFPVEATDDIQGDDPSISHPQGAQKRRGERGIALLIAIMIISIMMLFTSELIIMSQVNITLATHQRDNVKAEFLAKSGMNAALLLLASDKAFDLYQAQQNPKQSVEKPWKWPSSSRRNLALMQS
jgi:hypothetical protein